MTERSQVAQARLTTHHLARTAGLSEEDQHRAGLIVTELATNLVKHTAAGGELLLRADAADVPSVEVIGIDSGPGIRDLGAAFRDGHSSTGSAGTGLGSIRRMSDEFDVYSSRETGTVLFACVRAGRQPARNHPFLVSAISVAVVGEQVCGDGWALVMGPERALIAVVDGLGHGPGAHEAAMAVLSPLGRPVDRSCGELLARMHEAGRHTRGAAGAVAELRHDAATMQFAGVGNVAGVIIGEPQARHMVSNNGTLGHNARVFRDFSYPWSTNSLLVLHTDGITTHWSLDRYPGLAARHPALTAGVLYRDFSRQRDDVTVLVAREAP